MMNNESKEPLLLLVDDLEFMRQAALECLVPSGFTAFIEAENGRHAIEQYKLHHPALVILDITMPVMDGLQALKQIKQLEPKAKVVMCSAMGEQSYVIEAILLGASDFVVKPYTAERLVSAVQFALKR